MICYVIVQSWRLISLPFPTIPSDVAFTFTETSGANHNNHDQNERNNFSFDITNHQPFWIAQTGSHAALEIVYANWLTICNIEATTVSLLSEVDFASAIMGKTATIRA